MFKIGDKVICVEIGSVYWSRRQSDGIPKSLTEGKMYEIINWEEDYVWVKNDNNLINKYLAERFVPICLDRELKLKKICSRLETR
jgi:hypothetical protein